MRVNPAALTPNILPPPVLIERFRCEGEDIPLPSDGAQELLHIPPGRERFEFRFTALSLVAPEKVRFKYRLTGLEPNWVEQRERSASYSYLQPGDYVFEVVACNNDGLWNETGARLAFTVLPFFWQTLWFRVTAYVASCLAVAGVVYQRHAAGHDASWKPSSGNRPWSVNVRASPRTSTTTWGPA